MADMVIRLMGMADGLPTAYAGRWLVDYDPTRPGTSPEGLPVTAHLETTDDKSKAKRFEPGQGLFDYMRASHGVRADGEPDRPLLAFHLMIEPADEHEALPVDWPELRP